MIRITVKTDGMMCGMCENHINDAIRKFFSIKKVNSSHSKGETVIITEDDISEDSLKSVFDDIGYKILSIDKEPYEKKKLFSFR